MVLEIVPTTQHVPEVILGAATVTGERFGELEHPSGFCVVGVDDIVMLKRSVGWFERIEEVHLHFLTGHPPGNGVGNKLPSSASLEPRP